ncbi:MAG TPA: hypothetical protein VFT76_00240 [Actinomycetota bacterium]|nr:hypothetical protein [Actinomycetota bacterium]
MASAFYEDFRNQLFNQAGTHGAIDLDAAGTNVKVGLRDEGTTALNLATQVDHADISSALVATSGNVANKTVGTAGVGAFDHDNVTYTAVSGNSVESLDYYKDSGTSSTSPLIANIDEGSVTGLPVTPNGGDITWTPAAGGVFQIT